MMPEKVFVMRTRDYKQAEKYKRRNEHLGDMEIVVKDGYFVVYLYPKNNRISYKPPKINGSHWTKKHNINGG